MPDKPNTLILPPVEYLRECFIYEPETGMLTWKKRPCRHFSNAWAWKVWTPRFAGAMAGKITHEGYSSVSIQDQAYFSHRIIWKLMTGNEPPLSVDHIDGDKINNRWKNLRAATIAEQKWNVSLQKNNTSGFKGVCRLRSKWQALIRINGVSHYLGVFDTSEQAAAAYEAAARVLHGEFYHGALS